MKTLITAALLSLGLLAGTAHASDAQAKCEAQAAEKKLAGAAKNSFVKKCTEDAKAATPTAAGADACEKAAAEKKLAGAAKNSFMKKCAEDAQKACEATAAEKKLAGAARTSFMKKCEKDAVGE